MIGKRLKKGHSKQSADIQKLLFFSFE